MTKIREWLKGKKTYILAGIAIAGIVVGWASGDIAGVQALWGIAEALGFGFVRAGVAKTFG